MVVLFSLFVAVIVVVLNFLKDVCSVFILFSLLLFIICCLSKGCIYIFFRDFYVFFLLFVVDIVRWFLLYIFFFISPFVYLFHFLPLLPYRLIHFAPYDGVLHRNSIMFINNLSSIFSFFSSFHVANSLAWPPPFHFSLLFCLETQCGIFYNFRNLLLILISFVLLAAFPFIAFISILNLCIYNISLPVIHILLVGIHVIPLLFSVSESNIVHSLFPVVHIPFMLLITFLCLCFTCIFFIFFPWSRFSLRAPKELRMKKNE